MTWASKTDVPGKAPLYVLELEGDGINPGVLAATNSDGSRCYATPATTFGQAWTDVDALPRIVRFSLAGNPVPIGAPGPIVPSISSVRVTDDRLRLGEGLGEFGQCSITLSDHQDDDVGEDPFWPSRSPRPAEGSYWRRKLARNPFWFGRRAWLREIYSDGTAWADADHRIREYRVRAISGPDQRGAVSITLVGPLQLTRLSKAEAPAASPAVLLGDITSFDGGLTLDFADDLPTSGLARVGDELMTFTRIGPAVSLASRGDRGTIASEHSAGDGFQPCADYVAQTPDLILADLLTTYAGIDPAFIPAAAWATAINGVRSLHLLTRVLSEPIEVTKLVNELCEQCAIFLWYDAESGLIQLDALKPPNPGQAVDITDEDMAEPITLKVDISKRVSRQDVAIGLRSPVADPGELASYRARLVPDAVGEGQYEHREPARGLILAGWLNVSQVAQAARTARAVMSSRSNGEEDISLVIAAAMAATLTLGAPVLLTSRDLVNADGAPAPTLCVVVAIEPVKVGHTYRLTLARNPYAGRWAYVGNNAAEPDYALATAAERDPSCYVAQNSGLMPGGDPGYAIV